MRRGINKKIIAIGWLFVTLLPLGAGGQQAALTLTIQPNPANTDELVTVSATPAAAGTVYTWSVNGTVRPELSGTGKSTAFFAAPSAPGVLRIGLTAKVPTDATTTTESLVPLNLSQTTKTFQGLQNQATDLLIEQQRLQDQLMLALAVSPPAPAPGEATTLTVSSFQADLSDAAISWFANGKRVSSGTGLTAVAIPLGGAGSATNVRVLVDLGDGRRAEAERIITPAAVGFYWWADSYVPAWYRGKALPAPGATIFIQARPSFPPAVSQSLVYTWFLNDEVMREVSGKGSSVFGYTVPGNANALDTIKVRVTNLAGTIAQEATFATPVATPEPLLYEVAPLAGPNTATALRSLAHPAGTPLDLTVEPFFLPRAVVAKLQYQWNLNGTTLSSANAKRPRVLTVSSDPGAVGRQAVRVSLIDPAGAFFETEQNLELNLE